jgi:ERF superfamily
VSGRTLTLEQKLQEKLFKARKEAQGVGRKGEGKSGEEDYYFSRFEDVLAEAKRLLEKHRIVYTASVIEEELHFGQKGCLAKVVIEYTVTDLTSGGSLTVRWSGTGFDSPGGTAIFMAQTGTEKYFLAKLLQIPWGEDPETQEAGTEAEQVRAAQDRAAEEPQVSRRLKPVPQSDLPEPDWSGLGDTPDQPQPEEPARV